MFIIYISITDNMCTLCNDMNIKAETKVEVFIICLYIFENCVSPW